jgi:hypothetical protein
LRRVLLLQIAGMGEALGIEFYLFCFTDLFGVLRSKLVPASAVRSIATGGESAGNSAAAPELEIYLPDRLRAGTGAGFAGFAAYMDMSPADGVSPRRTAPHRARPAYSTGLPRRTPPPVLHRPSLAHPTATRALLHRPSLTGLFVGSRTSCACPTRPPSHR